MTKNQALRSYQENGFDKVEGWCHHALIEIADTLDSVEINKVGGAFEIGIYHGKFFILLNQLIEASASSVSVDIFDDQHLNIDSCGTGSLAAFKRNLSEYDVHRGKNTTIIAGDSTDTRLELVRRFGPGSMRFVSIDGGHTVEHTLNDLRIANELVSNEGVVFLDDILNAGWLGVIEATCKFLNSSPTLVPFAIGFNKLYMCKLSYQKFYSDLFATSRLRIKGLPFCGYNIQELGIF